jgi:hypothetical protein
VYWHGVVVLTVLTVQANSDGSSSDRNLDRVTPTMVLAKFIHDTAMHGADGEH